MIDARGHLDLRYDRGLGRGWNIVNRTYYDQFNNDGNYVYDYSESSGLSRVLNKNYAHGKWWGDEVILSKQLVKTQRLTIGSEFRNNFRQDQGNYDVPSFNMFVKAGPQLFLEGELRTRTVGGIRSRSGR